MQRIPILVLLVLAWVSGASASMKPDPVQTRIFMSRAAISKALGEHVANGVPADFNFELFALVWVELPVSANPGVQITTLPADKDHWFQHSAALGLRASRTTQELVFELIVDMPCSGGIPKLPEQMAVCSEAVAASGEEAEKTLHLFATPRAKLKAVKATRVDAPPRP